MKRTLSAHQQTLNATQFFSLDSSLILSRRLRSHSMPCCLLLYCCTHLVCEMSFPSFDMVRREIRARTPHACVTLAISCDVIAVAFY